MFGISKATIEKKIEDHLVTELAKTGEVDIKGVGTLSYYDGNVVFTPKPSFVTEIKRQRSASSRG